MRRLRHQLCQTAHVMNLDRRDVVCAIVIFRSSLLYVHVVRLDLDQSREVKNLNPVSLIISNSFLLVDNQKPNK